ncbi:hypothetical protein [Streptomyces curacoi]|uniref:Uncharacterized protein n=1 Tax=Streptomyces curacoi TaxID=146536 RepID=A0A117P5J6_9ACTN|nr:hypothetical protein [Streptomyces curacoi]KUM73436.1 hypothetical protein AQI70_21975 [Streptomyces curacoi]
MFGLISTLAEILSSHWGRLLDGRQLGRDAAVARHLMRVVVALQDLCLRGEQLLVLAAKLLDGEGTPETSAEFAGTLDQQAREVAGLRSLLDESKGLMATIDAQLYLDLAPLVDQKSGLLTRWGRQAALSEFSTTTLFFLPAGDLARLIETGRASAGPDGLDVQRTTYVVAVADSIRNTRSREVRDIRLAAQGVQDRVRAEIASARADLARAKEYCSTLRGATETAVGPEAMARLRRTLLP